MLLYEYRVRDQFERLRQYAERVQAGFDAARPSAELLMDAQNLTALADTLMEMLPEQVRKEGNAALATSQISSSSISLRSMSHFGDGVRVSSTTTMNL
jgi:hypothetical protein